MRSVWLLQQLQGRRRGLKGWRACSDWISFSWECAWDTVSLKTKFKGRRRCKKLSVRLLSSHSDRTDAMMEANMTSASDHWHQFSERYWVVGWNIVRACNCPQKTTHLVSEGLFLQNGGKENAFSCQVWMFLNVTFSLTRALHALLRTGCLREAGMRLTGRPSAVLSRCHADRANNPLRVKRHDRGRLKGKGMTSQAACTTYLPFLRCSVLRMHAKGRLFRPKPFTRARKEQETIIQRIWLESIKKIIKLHRSFILLCLFFLRWD